MAMTGTKILVANLGSTSFKYRLFDMTDEHQLARGSVERIGSSESLCRVVIGGYQNELTERVPDHAAAVRQCLDQLTDVNHGCLRDSHEVAGIGFKAVHGGRISGVQRVNELVLEAMEEMNRVAPAHNPPYIAAMRLLSRSMPEIPLVAAFETGFHQTVAQRQQRYAIPRQWSEKLGIKKWGFHGASHRYIAERTGELLQRNDLRIVSCHLGGSSSLCAMRDGQSEATSMGISPQSGLPQNNRVGDFDPFALPRIMEQTGMTLEEVLDQLATQSGLLGMSGVSGDIRDLEDASADGDHLARLALEVYVTEIRRYLGGMLVELGGADVLVFTGGIGENRVGIRSAVCRNLDQLGIVLDEQANRAAVGECELTGQMSQTRIWVIPTNEELIVARQTYELLRG